MELNSSLVHSVPARLPAMLRAIRETIFPHWSLWLGLTALFCLQLAWIGSSSRFTISSRWSALIIAALLVAALGIFHRLMRADAFSPSLLAFWRMGMASALSVLILPNFRVLNHLVMSVPFPPADALLHGWDQAIGFDWNSYARWVASVEGLPLLLSFAYNEWMMIGLGAITFGACALNRPERVNELAFLMIVTGLASILVGAAFPAAAAWVMIATDEVKSTLGLYPQMEWYRQLGELRSGAPVFLDAARLEGLSTFPSFHTCLGLIILWCSRGHWLTLAAGALTSLAILAATPVFGGHYLVDMLAGGVVTALAVALWHWVRPWLRVADPNAACLEAFPPLFPRQFTFQRDGL